MSPSVGLYVGTYTVGQHSKGIYRLQLNTQTGMLSEPTLAVEAVNPSFLALDSTGRFLYAVNESVEGEVRAYAVGRNRDLTPINSQPSLGGWPCHVSVCPGDKSVLVANYRDGSVAGLAVRADGSLSSANESFKNTGTGPNRERQEGPHAHSIFVDPKGLFAYSCDLGTDEVLAYPFHKAKGEPALSDPVRSKSPAGSGPRHGVFDPRGKFLYVDNEMTNSVSVFSVEPRSGALHEVQNIPTLPAGMTSHGSTTAEIVLHPNGKWLYVSNRGHDSIAGFEIGRDGRLKLIEIKDLSVKVPRGFAIDPTGKWLVAAGQNSNDLEAMGIDPKSGALGPGGAKISVSSPVCVLFMKP